MPEFNAGRRYQNTFLTVLWFMEIASYVNSSLNIFVYYSMGSRYRKTVKELFCRGRVAAKLDNTGTELTTTVGVVATTARC